ncbi:MAG TPA: YqgE/AlgH family protein [Cyclobacteriaceae bacterium]|nr:YqgE/AlgH family protein [Cyclobacteriaceae bacterium]
MEFFSYKTKLEPGKGKILVSEPYLPDPNFERTIILLCEHNDEGSFGFIMNKPSLAKLEDVMQDLKGIDAPVFIGGPVQQDTLHYIHRLSNLEESIEVMDGIFWGGNFDQLVSLIETKQVASSDIKFFLGYSGWSVGQIDEELKENSWIVSDKVNEELLFDIKAESMWQYALKRMGGRFSVYSNYPQDPRLN